MYRPPAALLALTLAVTATVACSTQNPEIDTSDPGPTVTLPLPGAEGGPRVSGAVSVFVAPELEAVGGRVARAFMRQNPEAEATVTAEPSKQSMLRFISGADADVFIGSNDSISLFRAYLRGLPRTRSFATDSLVLVVPSADPQEVRSLEDVGELEPEAVCTPPYMLETVELPSEELEVPVNERSEADCRKATADGVASGDLDAAILPGSGVGLLRLGDLDRIALPRIGNLSVDYGMVVVSDSQVAEGFANYAASSLGRAAIAEAGYR